MVIDIGHITKMKSRLYMEVFKGNEIEIRQTKSEDNQKIAAIGIKCWQDAYKDIFPSKLLNNLSLEKRLEQRLNWFSLPNRFSIIAQIEDKIVGFCDFDESRRPQFSPGEIYALYILPEYKSQGIGKSMMLDAMKQLKKHNLSPFIVTTLELNLPARKFYEKLGFKGIDQIMTKVEDKLYPETVYLFDRGKL